MNLSERLRRLEASAGSRTCTLTERDWQQLERWPEIMLEHYAEDRLDPLAVRTDIPVGDMLRSLAEDGLAIKFGGHWHPLFIGIDELVNAHVLARVFELFEEDTGFNAACMAALKRRQAPA